MYFFLQPAKPGWLWVRQAAAHTEPQNTLCEEGSPCLTPALTLADGCRMGMEMGAMLLVPSPPGDSSIYVLSVRVNHYTLYASPWHSLIPSGNELSVLSE